MSDGSESLKILTQKCVEKLNPMKNFLKDFTGNAKDLIKLQALSIQTCNASNSEMVKVSSNDQAIREIVAKLISTGLGIAATIGVSYFFVKWMSNAMDPTRKEKVAAQQKV